jgi:hypothetical protein
MATMPGISVQTDATDVVNRPAVSVSADGGTSQLLLDPHTYQVSGARFYAPKDQPTRAGDAARKGKPVAPGTLTESMARTETTLVGGPGQS